ncbi:MAG: hypothetical protein AAGJ40_00490 [Planctomycetota bacterium]
MLRFALICLMTASGWLASSSSASIQAKEAVRYRCVEWKAKHIHDTKKADKIAETLKKLKCEVERHAHNGHEDLKYRCKEWKTLELKTHDEAHQWETWLKQYGFETQHQH